MSFLVLRFYFLALEFVSKQLLRNAHVTLVFTQDVRFPKFWLIRIPLYL